MTFRLGRCLATPGALDFCEAHQIDLLQLLTRHRNGDWGDLCVEDKKANEDALKSGARILSSYTFPAGKVWVITDAEDDFGVRASTCVMLPSEY